MKVTKTVKFEMAHRLVRHPGLCKNLHGHSYVVDITVEGPNTQDGMVLDFGIIKTIWKEFDEKLDHSVMLEKCEENSKLIEVLQEMGMKLNLCKYNPTAENMAIEFKRKLQKALNDYCLTNNILPNLIIDSVKVHETVGAVAEA